MTYAVPVTGRSGPDFTSVDSSEDGGLDRAEGQRRAGALTDRLAELQELLYSASVESVLVVLQGMDSAGKDGTIRHVMSKLDPRGVDVAYFHVPTDEELAHDFLWRIHARVPARGQMVIFNRSHYEDVLAPRVRKLVAPQVWQGRYRSINDFEHHLIANGTLLFKFFLHVSKKEETKRLKEREEDPEKAYKISPTDWADFALRDRYMGAYRDAIRRCSSPEAPWWIVPADHKWFRNLAVAEVLVKALEARKSAWRSELRARGKHALAELAKVRRGRPT
ncbi:MAG: PPK2 family polyphosphate kinase [Thermoplasmatota archaeon]